MLYHLDPCTHLYCHLTRPELACSTQVQWRYPDGLTIVIELYQAKRYDVWATINLDMQQGSNRWNILYKYVSKQNQHCSAFIACLNTARISCTTRIETSHICNTTVRPKLKRNMQKSPTRHTPPFSQSLTNHETRGFRSACNGFLSREQKERDQPYLKIISISWTFWAHRSWAFFTPDLFSFSEWNQSHVLWEDASNYDRCQGWPLSFLPACPEIKSSQNISESLARNKECTTLIWKH